MAFRWGLPVALGSLLARAGAVGELAADEVLLSASRLLEEDEACSATDGPACALGMLQLRAMKRAEELENPQNASKAVAEGLCWNRPFPGGAGTEQCFAQLARNPASADTACSCPQGCIGTASNTAYSAVFKNKASAHGCPDNTVLLTSPSGYFRDPKDLASANGGSCKDEVISQLLTDSWNAYQAGVGEGAVWQCFHGSAVASVKYLHLQTFCAAGQFHGMPTKNHYVAHCVVMESLGQVAELTQQFSSMIHA